MRRMWMRCQCGERIDVTDDYLRCERRFRHGEGEAVLIVADADAVHDPDFGGALSYAPLVLPWLDRVHAYERRTHPGMYCST